MGLDWLVAIVEKEEEEEVPDQEKDEPFQQEFKQPPVLPLEHASRKIW